MKYIFLGGHDSLGGGEDILSSWRKHLELLGGGQDRGNTPGSPHTVRSSTPLDGGMEGGNIPCSTPSIEGSPRRNTGNIFFIYSQLMQQRPWKMLTEFISGQDIEGIHLQHST